MLSGISPLCRLYCPTAFITASWVGKKSWATSGVPATSERAQVTLVLLGQCELSSAGFWLLHCCGQRAWLGLCCFSLGRTMLSFSWWLSLGDILHCSGSGNEFCMEWCVCCGTRGDLGHWVFLLLESVPSCDCSNETAIIWKQKYILF